MKIYITRHGQTEWNIAGRFQGWLDSPLTQKGIGNAISLSKTLSNIKFEEVISSPAGRTMHTARLASGLSEELITQSEALREINMGDWEGRRIEDIKRDDAEQFDYFWNSPDKFKRKNSEDFCEVQKRAIDLVQRLIEKYGERDVNVLLVTHAGTLKSIMAFYENRHISKLWEPPYMHDTCLNLLEYKNGKVEILLHGDCSHMEQPEEEY